MFLIAAPAVANSSQNLPAPPSVLPTITYYYNGTEYNISNSVWVNFFSNVIDNKKYVTYNWSAVDTQYLIVFDLSYTSMNPYGAYFLLKLSETGSPTMANMTKAFLDTENVSSHVKGYTNIQALDAGAYPGFSFSKPVVARKTVQYEEAGAIIAIIAGMFVLYFIFNRKK